MDGEKLGAIFEVNRGKFVGKMGKVRVIKK